MQSRIKYVILFVGLAAMVLVACGPAATPVPTATATQEPPQVPVQSNIQESYPAPDQSNAPGSYPAPAPSGNEPVYSPYPGPSEGVTNFMDWSQAEQTILDGKVAKAYEAPTQHITLVLKDGSVALTMEPTLDEVQRVIERCGEACKDIEKISQ